ncbi:MAG: glycosyltransferase family 4 protein [Chloroflexi bacterium]|nr:glycosyltransferase family 4 protein [Chloroflexota bacterium]
MKIAYVYDVIHPYVAGGAQKRIWEVSRRLAQRGHDVTILGMKHWEGDNVIYKEGVKLWGVCPPQELHVNGRRSIKEALYFAWRVLPPLLKERFDVVDCQNFPYFPCFSAKLACVVRRSTLVITWHEVWDDYWFSYLGNKGFPGKVVERIIAHLGHRTVANSESTKRGLTGIGVRRIEVVSSGVDLEKTASVARSIEQSDVIFVGRLTREKNVDLLVKAVGRVQKEMPGIRCLVIGDGPERENIESLVGRSDLRDNVFLRGFVASDEQVLSLMKASKVLVLPSTREGLGLVVLEANACGLPVITVKHPQNAACDLVTDGQNGFNCLPSDRDIADRILTVMASTDGWADRCRDLARVYDWDAIVDALEAVYQSA